MTHPTRLLARYAQRPLLMRAEEAATYARQLQALDGRAFERPAGPFAFLRRAAQLGRARPVASLDEVEEAAERTPSAYAPRWLERRFGAPDDESDLGWSLKDGVALFCVDTPLVEEGFSFCGDWYHGYDTISEACSEMANDARVRAIHFRLDSPGGVAGEGLPALADQLRGMREAAGGKPIWVHAKMACSAAYWMASSCDRINAHPFGLVGSIGAVLVLSEVSRHLEQEGVTVNAIQFGAKKTDGAWWKPLSDSARADLQSEIDELGHAFVDDVTAGRASLTTDAILAQEAGCFLAENRDASRSGLALGLVDDLMDESAAFAALRDHVAGSPSRQSPAAPAAHAADQEMDMNRSQVSAAARAAGFSSADIRRLEASLPAAEDDVEDEGPADEEEAEVPEEDDTSAQDPDDEPEAANAEEDESEATAPSAATSQAILALAEAKGREAQARTLAFTPGMTTASAKAILAAGPKGSRLSERMSGRDPNLTPGGGAAAPTGDFEAGKALAARLASHTGRNAKTPA